MNGQNAEGVFGNFGLLLHFEKKSFEDKNRCEKNSGNFS